MPTRAIFAQIENIVGDATDKAHAKDTVIAAFGWGGLAQAVSSSGSGSGAGKLTVGPICFVKPIDRGTTTIIADAAAGKHIQSAEFFFTTTDAKGATIDDLKIKLSDILITSYKTSPAGNSTGEEVEMTFQRADIEACPVDGAANGNSCTTVTVDATGAKI
jgi:type VI secretion system secreted protein Hcp